MVGTALRKAIDMEREHGLDSKEFERAFNSLKTKFTRENGDIINAERGRVYSVKLTEKRKRSLRIGVSHHAIDRASTRILDQWKRYSKKEEGIATWLQRMAHNWMKLQAKVTGPCIHDAWKGMRFAFAYNGVDSKGNLMFTMTTVVEA